MQRDWRLAAAIHTRELSYFRLTISCLKEVYPTWYAWIYVLATPETAEEYVCEITAKSAEENQEVRSDAVKFY